MPDPYLDYRRFQAQQDQFDTRQDNADDMMEWRRGESQARQARFDQSSGFRDRTTDLAELRAMAAAQRSMLPQDALAARQAIGQRVRDMGQPQQPQIGWAQLGAMREAQALPEPPAPGIGGRWQDMGGSRFGDEVHLRGGGIVNFDPSLSEAEKSRHFDELTASDRQMGMEQQQPQPQQGNMAQMQAAAMRAQMQQQAEKRLGSWKSMYGVDPGTLAAGFDRKRNVATIPGRYHSDSMGGFTREPGREIPMQLGEINAINNDRAALAGAGSYEELQMQDPRHAALVRLKQRATERNLPPQMVDGIFEDLAKRGSFTEADINTALDRHETNFWATHAAQQKAWQQQRARDMGGIEHWAKPDPYRAPNMMIPQGY